MAKKAELLEQAHKLKLDVGNSNTIAEIEAAIAGAEEKRAEKKAAKTTTELIDEIVETEEIAEAIVEAEAELDAEEATAKAGKRSAKAIKEAEEKAAKEERKAQMADSDAPKPKPTTKTRSKLERQGKKLREAAKLVEKGKEYNLKQALDLATKTSTVKFDASVELHINLGVDPRHADQNVRATLVLPAGTGKSVKVAVFADADDAATAKKAGADIVGSDDFLQQLEKGVIDFDILIATPAMMPKLGKYARTLGPKGLMPSPKSGTVTTDVAKAVSEAKAGRVEYRVDSTGIVHVAFGKVSFGPEKLESNARAVLSSVKAVKPASLKGIYVKAIHVSTTMGPSIRVASSEI